MAILTTNFADSTAFGTTVTTTGVDFTDFSNVRDILNAFQDSTRNAGESFDETTSHRTGNFSTTGLDNSQTGFSGGTYHVVGTLPLGTDSGSWMVNGMIADFTSGGPQVGELTLLSTGGLTVNPPLSDHTVTGIINQAHLVAGDHSTFGLEYDFVGALGLPVFPATGTSTISATLIHIHSEENLDTTPDIRDGSIGGAFTITVGANGHPTNATGKITSISFDINGQHLDASGFSIDAKELFTAGDNTPPSFDAQFDTLFSHILSGNDLITGTTDNQVLKGYAGNDTLVGGGNNDALIGGVGNDFYDLTNATNATITEGSTGQGTDTVKMGGEIDLTALAGGNLESAIETDNSGHHLTGNTASNTLTGSTYGNDTLDGGTGADSLTGGFGSNWYFLDNTGDKVGAEAVNGGFDTVYSSVNHTLLANYEWLILQDAGGNINGTGNASDNNLYGNNSNNVLSGLAGNDYLDGGGAAGNDTLLGGDGNDTLIHNNSTGASSMDGGTGNDSITGGTGFDKIAGGTGDDSIQGGGGNDTIAGGDGNDTIVGSGAGNTSIDGGNGDDSIQGGDGNDTIAGGAGNDFIDGGEGADSLSGGAGDDVIYGSPGANTIDGGAGNDIIQGGSANDLFMGGDGDDAIIGLGGNDTMLGGAGNDFIAGGGGNDSIDGGAGNDEIQDAGGTSTITGGGGNTILGGAGDDTISTVNFANSIDGGAGNDTVILTVGGGAITLGGATENLIFGSEGGGASTGTGNALGNIFTSNSSNNDTFIGLAGNDTYNIQTGDTITESTLPAGGTDLAVFTTATGETYTLVEGGGVENLTLNGSEAGGIGNSLANVLTDGGNYGSQHFDGGAGNDTYNVFAGDSASETDSLTGAGHIDLVNAKLFGSQSYTLGNGSNIENLTLVFGGEGISFTGTGNELNNVITGASVANNTLNGGAGNDTLYGGAGNDMLSGGVGIDSLSGGAGNDSYVFDITDAPLGVSATVTALPDAILDTGGIDTLVLNGGEATHVVLTLATALENLDASALTPGSDVNITGNGSNNSMLGSAGNDTLSGGLGNDTLNGGLGNDQLIGGLGNDSYVLELTNTIHLFEGIPQAFGDISLNTSEVSDTGGNDTLVLVGGAGNPSATPADNPLLAGTVFTYTVGANTLDPFENVDASGMDVAVKAIILNGTAGNNRLIGGSGNDTITGNGGNDTLGSGFGGDDSLIGGTGNDTYLVNHSTQIAVDGGGTDLVIASIGDGQGYTLGGGLDNLTLIDATPASILYGFGNELNNVITGASNGEAQNQLYGQGGNDSITGGDQSDYLQGGDGNDNISGGAGNDWLEGDAGADTLAGGLGDDTFWVNLKAVAVGALEDMISDTGGTDTLDVVGNNSVTGFTFTMPAAIDNLNMISAHFNTTLTGGAGDNHIVGGFNQDKIDGGAGNDSLDGGEGSDTLIGGVGNDTLDGGEGNNTSLAGNNSLDGGAGNDSLHGGSMNDTLVGGAGNDTLDGGEGHFTTDSGGNDSIVGGDGDDSISGGSGSDTMLGGAGNDSITGYHHQGDAPDGNDSFDGGLGDDSYAGGNGNDTYVLAQANDVIEGDSGGTDTIITSLVTSQFSGHGVFTDANGALALGNESDIENVTYTGAAGIEIDGTSSANNIASTSLTSGADTLAGGGGNDTLAGGAGNDRLDGGEGANSMDGGAGDDSMYGGNFMPNGGPWITNDGDTMTGGAGNDTLDGGEGGNDELHGGAGDDSIFGGNDNYPGPGSNDSLFGDAGNDTLDGGYGNDTMDGGAGNDVFYVDNPNDLINGVAGDGIDKAFINTSFFDAGSNAAFVENFVLQNGVTFLSNALANSITGSVGNDLIAGGGGNDTVAGGNGGDEFVLGWGSPAISAGNVMTIKDFSQADHDSIGLSTAGVGGMSFRPLFSNPDAGALLDDAITNGTAANAAHAQLIYNFAQGKLYYDADGNTPAGTAPILIAVFDPASKPIELHNADLFAFSGAV